MKFSDLLPKIIVGSYIFGTFTILNHSVLNKFPTGKVEFSKSTIVHLTENSMPH